MALYSLLSRQIIIKGDQIKKDVSCLYGNITAQEGFPSSVTVKYENPYLTDTTEIRETRRLYAEAGVGIVIWIPILGDQKIGVSKKRDLITPIDRSLLTWQLFKTSINQNVLSAY
jgi:hypothetical protein